MVLPLAAVAETSDVRGTIWDLWGHRGPHALTLVAVYSCAGLYLPQQVD